MRFDAWNATYPNVALHEVRSALQEVLGATLEPRKGGLHGYTSSELIKINGATHGILAYGGFNARFFAEVKGEAAQVWADFVQGVMLDGFRPDGEQFATLTRADICHDWRDSRDVASLEPTLRAHVASAPSASGGRPPQWSQFGDFHSPEGRSRGCTLYMGSSTSSVRVRIYDKGAEVAAKGGDAPSDLRRAEVQVRPQSRSEKETWAHFPPDTFWNISGSVRAVASCLDIKASGEISRLPAPPSDLETLKTLAAFQYGDAIKSLVLDAVQTGAGVGDFLDVLCADIDRRKQRRLRRAS